MENEKRLIYLPLGGAGEIGMNMYLYGYGFPGAEEFIVVDVGVSFPDMGTSPGVDLIIPDFFYIEENKERLLGIFITHAHEDHIGAIGHLIKNHNVPIFCREFSAQIAFSKLEKSLVRERVLNGEPRIDGRDLKTVRAVEVEVGVLPKTQEEGAFLPPLPVKSPDPRIQ